MGLGHDPTTKGMHGQAVVQIKNFHHLRRRAKHVDILTTGRWGLKAYRFPGQTRFIIIAFGIGGLEEETDGDKWSGTSVSSIAHANCRRPPRDTLALVLCRLQKKQMLKML